MTSKLDNDLPIFAKLAVYDFQMNGIWPSRKFTFNSPCLSTGW